MMLGCLVLSMRGFISKLYNGSTLVLERKFCIAVRYTATVVLFT